MNPRVLFIVTTDPRVSARPAEAIRIAAGVGAWQKVDPVLYLRGHAVLALGDDAEELVEGENFARYLPIVRESSPTIHVQQGAPFPDRLADNSREPEAIDDTQLAELAATCHYVLRF